MIKQIHKFIATFFGAGYSPFAPGTVGATFAFTISLILYFHLSSQVFFQVHVVLTISSLILGTISTKNVMTEWGKDPSRVVIDEAHGFWLALLFIPPNVTNLILALILFRVFDIAKPLGIKYFDKQPTALSVMLDDSLAGIYAGLSSLAIIHYIFA